MKILFATYSYNVQGGIEVWLDTLTRFLSANGWDVTTALARGSRFNIPERYRAQWPEHRYVELDGLTGTNEGRIRAVTRAVEDERPDIVVAVTLGHALAAVGRMKGRGFPVRLVMPVHATNTQVLEEAMAFAPVLDRCVGVNALHVEALIHHGFSRERTATVVNGATPPRAVAPRVREPGSTLRILFAGRVHDETKRVFDLPEISRELQRRGVPFTFTVAGDGPDLPQLRDRLDAGFLGWVDQDRLRNEVLPQHDVLLVTSPPLGEAGPPLVALEAMSAGTVPVTSEFVGVHAPGSIRDGETALLFDCGNASQAAERLEALYRDDALWKRLSDASRARAAAFTLDESLRKWDAVLRSVGDDAPLRPAIDVAFPLSERDRESGRLEKVGLPPVTIDAFRRLARRFPQFDDAWGEWPGTLAPASDRFTIDELAALDRHLAKSSVLA